MKQWGRVGEEAGSREIGINDAKRSENGGRGGRQGQGVGMGHPWVGVNWVTLEYDG